MGSSSGKENNVGLSTELDEDNGEYIYIYIYTLLIIQRTSGFLGRLTAELFAHPE